MVCFSILGKADITILALLCLSWTDFIKQTVNPPLPVNHTEKFTCKNWYVRNIPHACKRAHRSTPTVCTLSKVTDWESPQTKLISQGNEPPSMEASKLTITHTECVYLWVIYSQIG